MTLPKPASPGPAVVLITGATGYIGGGLVAVLDGVGVRLRCLARRPAALASRVSQTTEVVAEDGMCFLPVDAAITTGIMSSAKDWRSCRQECRNAPRPRVEDEVAVVDRV